MTAKSKDSAHEIGKYSDLLGQVRGGAELDADFAKAYRRFWVMRYVSPGYMTAHMRELERRKRYATADPAEICRSLREDTTEDGQHAPIQFSFATKLAHMIDPDLPIYDTLVRQFFFLPEPTAKDFEARLSQYMQSYDFLKVEYRRVLEQGLLAPAIQAFRTAFPACGHSDIKVVDWLLWQFVRMVNAGALRTGGLMFS